MTEPLEGPERAVSTTVNGLPFPDPEDPVAEGAAAIRALAENIQVTGGRVNFAGGTNSETVTITLPVGLFTKAPFVVGETSSTYTYCGFGTATTAAVSCSIIYRSTAGAIANLPANTPYLTWVAIGIY